MSTKALGRGLKEFERFLDATDDENRDYETQKKPITNEQIKKLKLIKDLSIRKFIEKKANDDFNSMEICLGMYEFLKEYFAKPPKSKNYKNDQVIHKFNEISSHNKELKVKECIQLTAHSLNITIYAVRNHIYKK